MAIKIVRFLPLNWHYLTECDPLPIGNSCFITGANTSGKSTLLDAFRFLFFVTTTGFNAANGVAGKRGGRKLVSYIRAAKTDGAEDDGQAAYLRTGATVTHVAAELYNEDSRISSVIGVTAAMPAITDSNDVRPQWWVLQQGHLKDLQFSIPVGNDGIRYATLEELCRLTPAGGSIYICKSQGEAKALYSKLLGLTTNHLGDVSALNTWAVTQNNAIAFDPREMGNLNKFIKTLVIPEAPIRTEEFRQLLENYQDLQRQSANMELQVQKLKAVLDICGQYKALRRQERAANILDDLIQTQLKAREIKALLAARQVQTEQIRQLTEQLRHIDAQRGSIRGAIAAFNASEEEEAIRQLQASLDHLNAEITTCKNNIMTLDDIVDFLRSFAAQTNQLFGSPLVQTSFLDRYEATSDEPFSSQDAHALRELAANIQDAQTAISARNERLKTVEKPKLASRISNLKREQEILEKGSTVAGPRSHSRVRAAIHDAFRDQHISDEPKYLCELLEYRDEQWADAAEAYMGSYRFSIVVQPQNFRCAAEAYKKLCREDTTIYGVTLVDTTAFADATEDAPANTLAGIFKSRNHYAAEYVKYVYSRVKLVADASYPPDKDGICISRDGMKYAGRGYSRMRPVEYLVIGAQARARRLKAVQEELAEVKQAFQAAQREMNQCVTLTAAQRDWHWPKFLTDGQALLRQRRLLLDYQAEYDRQEVQLRKLASPERDRQRAALDAGLRTKNTAYEETNTALAKSNGLLLNAETALTAQRESLAFFEKRAASWEQDYHEEYQHARQELAQRQTDQHKSLKGIHETLETEIDEYRKTLAKLDLRISAAQAEYNSAFSTAYDTAGYASMEAYQNFYNEMTSSRIPELRHRTDTAFRLTEASFADKIVGDLRTHIKAAESTLKAINRFLARMVYNERVYQFAPIRAAVGKEEFFRMIMDENNRPSDGDQLPIERTAFDRDFSDTKRALFDRVRNADIGRDDEWLDYRSYCQFGVTLAPASDRQRSSLLKDSIGDGSGAEVQVPCYIILAAALVQQYNKSNRLHSDITNSNSLRVMLVDECFDKMDTANRKAMIDFITRQMGLQLIACAPPDKYESVGTLLENVLFVRGSLAARTRDVSYFTSPSFGALAAASAGDNDTFTIDPARFAAAEAENRAFFASDGAAEETT